MDSWICPKCSKPFEYLSYLKRHVLNNSHCNMLPEELNEYIKQLNKNKILETKTDSNKLKCITCGKTYKYKTAMYKHFDEQGLCKNIDKIKNTTTTNTINSDSNIIEALKQTHQIYIKL